MKAEILICNITDFVCGVRVDGKLLDKEDWETVKVDRVDIEEGKG